PSLAGPRRPQDRIRLSDVKGTFHEAVPQLVQAKGPKPLPVVIGRWEGEGGDGVVGGGGAAVAVQANGRPVVRTRIGDEEVELSDGSVVIAAITSCTNTSNPSVMMAAGLLAKKAVERGLRSKSWVKTSLAPGSK